MKQILSLSDYSSSNKYIEDSSFFYISRKKKIIPYYDIFVYYFFIINEKVYIHDYEFKHVLDYIVSNKVSNPYHIDLLNNHNFSTIFLDKAIFIKFIHTNAGHAFGNIMNTIYYLHENNLNDYNIVITEDLIEFSTFLTSIIYLFFDKSKIVIINDTTLVKFDKSYIIKDYSFKEHNTTNYLLNKLKNNIEPTLNFKYDNICLIKSFITKNQNQNKAFSNDYNDYIKRKNFEIITPENFDIIELFKIIYNAKNIILSWGCCSYLNSVFVNKKSNVLVLCHKSYSKEYEAVINYQCGIFDSAWFPEKSNKKLIMYDLETEINEEIKKMLDVKIVQLINV
jgi:capsular polysaccharide biosynthesis protein